MYLPLWLRLWRTLGTTDFNIAITHPRRGRSARQRRFDASRTGKAGQRIKETPTNGGDAYP
jgi:hypothetical protein